MQPIVIFLIMYIKTLTLQSLQGLLLRSIHCAAAFAAEVMKSQNQT